MEIGKATLFLKRTTKIYKNTSGVNWLKNKNEPNKDLIKKVDIGS